MYRHRPLSRPGHCRGHVATAARAQRATAAAAAAAEAAAAVAERATAAEHANAVAAERAVRRPGPSSLWEQERLWGRSRSTQRASARLVCSLCTRDDHPVASRATEKALGGVKDAPRDRAFLDNLVSVEC